MIPSIIINVILLIAIVYLVFVHIGAIKDEDKNFIPDSLEDKVKGIKQDISEIKSRLGEEIGDVKDAVKEVGDQLGDIPDALKTKRTSGLENIPLDDEIPDNLPVAFKSSRLERPSIRTKCYFPISRFAFSPASILKVSMTSANLLCLTSSGTESSNFLEACVLSLSEYANVNACSYLTIFKREIVSRCSCSVSSQNPEIKSELKNTSSCPIMSCAFSIKFK